MSNLDELRELVESLRKAINPEDIFGALSGTPGEKLAAARRTYRQLARAVHPDVRAGTADDDLANEGFVMLNKLWERAQYKIEHGTYGDKEASAEPLTLNSRHYTHTVTTMLAAGDLCNVYRCTSTHKQSGETHPTVFKVARNQSDNDLVGFEAVALRELADANGSDDFTPYYPALIENLTYRDAASPVPRRANILGYDKAIKSIDRLYTLTEIRAHYQQGIEPKHMAWMWRRLLVALGFAHENNLVHGAVLPPHILIEPALHGLMLIDWTCAVPGKSQRHIPAISMNYRDWYPEEVLKKEIPLPSLDIFMGARCMVYLMGGDPVQKTLPASVPTKLQKFFEWCLLDGARMRPQNAWQLLEEFDDVIESLWGDRRFQEFDMPPK